MSDKKPSLNLIVLRQRLYVVLYAKVELPFHTYNALTTPFEIKDGIKIATVVLVVA